MVVDLIDERNSPIDETESDSNDQLKEKDKRNPRNLHKDFVSSLQMLGDFHDLLAPPQSIVSMANQAAAKAILFVSGISEENMSIKCCK